MLLSLFVCFFKIEVVQASTGTYYPTYDAYVHFQFSITPPSGGFGVISAASTFTAGQALYYFSEEYPNSYSKYRTFILFDTSGLADSAVIDSATLSLYVSTETWDTATAVKVYQWAGSSTEASSAEWDNIGAEYGSVNTPLGAGSYEVIAINVVAVNKTGLTRFLIATERDITAQLPASNPSTEAINFQASEYTGTTRDPKLTVTYHISDSTAPTYANIGYSNTMISSSSSFSCYWNDNIALSHYIFSNNNTGTWSNDTATAFVSTPSWANVSKTLNDTTGLVIGFRWFANDTTNNWNSTSIQTLTTTATVFPSYSDIGHNSTCTSSITEFSCYWDDTGGLSHYIFSTNNTGAWSNETTSEFSTAPEWANVTKTLNSTFGLVIGYQWFANNTAGNWNSTAVQTLTTTAKKVLQLPFDDETSTTANDNSDFENDGTITSVSRSYDGHYGMGLTFDGTGYITVVDDDSLDMTLSILLSAWIKPSTITESVIFDKPNSYGFYLTADGALSAMINDEFYNTTASVVTTGSWQHVVMEYNTSAVNIYVDETLELTSALFGEIVPSAFDLVLGDNFVGNLDEMQIFTSTSDDILDAIASYPYAYGCSIDTTACSWVISSLRYNFTNTYVRQNSSYPLTTVKFNFTDGISELGLVWESGTYTTYTGIIVNGSEKVTFVSKDYTTLYNVGILKATLTIGSVIQSTANVNVTLYCVDSLDNDDSLTIENRFSIYGIGALVTYEIEGDGSSISGGTLLDIMATNSSLTTDGSSIKVSLAEPNFQHLHALVHVYHDTVWDSEWTEPSTEFETAWFGFGVDYMIENCTWVNGWYVNITMTDGQADADNGWVQLNCSWYNAGNFVKSDTIYAMYEAYRENDTSTQFSLYIDLWISDTAGSSMVGGHVSSQYYGMSGSGWWLWETWNPVGGLATSSTFTDYLYDENGTVTTASTLKVFRVWDKLAKISSGTGASDECTWAIEIETLQIQTLPYDRTLVGIFTPVFMPTTTPDMPLGFFASLANVLSNALANLQDSVSSFVEGGTSLGASAINNAFEFAGVTDFISTLSDYVKDIGDFFEDSVGYILDLLTAFFTILSSIGLFIIEWIGGFITAIISIGNAMVEFLKYGYITVNGAQVSLVDAFQLSILTDLWEIFGGPEGLIASGALFIFLAIAWFASIDGRAKQYGGGWTTIFLSDIQSIISILSFILDLAWRVVNTVIDLTMRFINVFL